MLDYADGFWRVDAEKSASVVVCSGLVGKGALSLDMIPDFSSKLREALEMLGARLEELVALRAQNKPVEQWEPLASGTPAAGT